MKSNMLSDSFNMPFSKAVIWAMLVLAVNLLPACSSDEQVEEEVSHVTNEGPYGGYSLKWYKIHWRGETTEQRKWCHQQKETRASMQSCINADIGWKQGWKDPETNPPRHWEDGSRTDQ